MDDQTEQQALLKLSQWKAEPVQFVREAFGVEPDAWQIVVLNWYRDGKRRIAMQACKGPGKTCVLAWIILHFMLFENAQIAAISNSGANARNNLWKEIAIWRDKSIWLKSAYVMTATRIYAPSITGRFDPKENKDYERTWFCEMRTWSKTADDAVVAQTLQGLHADYVMVILDESGGMPDGIMVAAEGVLANQSPGDGKRSHIIQAGNPTMLQGPLYAAARAQRSLWEVMAITGDPENPNRTPRLSLNWCNEQIRMHGRNHPYVLVNVMGEFPPSSLNGLFDLNKVAAAIGRHLPLSSFDKAAKIIGVDVARFGDDLTVIYPRQGLAAFEPLMMRKAHPDDVAGQVATLMQEWDADSVMVDATGGYGDGVIDSLARIGITAIRVEFAGKPIKPKFYNKRAEILWNLCEWINNGGAIAPGEWAKELTEELTAITYTFIGDKILIEPKEDIKLKIGRSPDYSDALACTFAFPIAPKERDILAGIENRGDYSHAKTDYDPLSRA